MNSSIVASEKVQSTFTDLSNNNHASRMDKLIVDIRNWDPFKPKSLKAHPGPGWGCTITSDNHYAFSSGTDKKICIWDLVSSKKEGELIGHTNTPNFLYLIKNDSVLISVGWDGKVNFWNWREKSLIKEIHLNSSALYSAFLTKDESILFVGSSSQYVFVVDTLEMNEIYKYETEGTAFGLGIKSDKSELVSGTTDEILEIFDMSTKCSLSKTTLKTGAILTLLVGNNDTNIFIGTRTNVIKILSYTEKTELHTFNSHNNWVRTLLEVDRYLISCSADKLVKVFDIKNKKEILTIEGNEGFINGMSISQDKQNLLTSSSDGTLKVFNIGTLSRVITKETPSAIVAVQITHSEKVILTGSGDGCIRIYDINTFEVQKELRSHSKEIRKIRISNDDQMAASCSMDTTVVLWDLIQCESLTTFSKHTGKVHGLDFSPNCKLIASGGEDFNIYIWNTSTYELVFEVIAHSDSIFELKFQNDNETLISTGADKTIRLWSVNTKESLLKFETRTPIIDCADLSPDQQNFVYGCRDSVIRLWDWGLKEEITTFKVASGNVNSLRFLKDSVHFVSGSGDFIVRVWNCVEQRLEVALAGHMGSVKGISVSNNMNKVYSGCFKKQLKIWDLENVSQLELVDVSSVMDSYVYFSLVKHKDFPPNFLFKSNFSKLKINLLHYYCYLGLKKPLSKALKDGLPIKLDDDLRSPLYYAITRKSQTCVDTVLVFMIQLRKENLKLFLSYSNALRDDFPLLLENPSSYLEDFFDVLFYKIPGIIKFGVPIVSLPALSYTDSKWIDTKHFVNEGDADSSTKELIIEFKTLPFPIDCVQGSSGSIDIIDSITLTRNSKILRTELVTTYIRNKYENVWSFILILTIVNWVSLVIMIGLVFLSNEGKQSTTRFYILSAIYFILNILNSIYELIQSLATGWSYFSDIWNIIDMSKVLISFAWIAFENSEIEHPEDYEILTWFMIALNFLRGLTGFRTFDKTRHYTKLIVRSIFESSYFLLIFFYSTLTFGVLYYCTKYNDPIRFSIWKIPYELNNGNFENTSEFSLQYFTFILASIVNVIIILNLLISILGDSFESFQSEAAEVDCLEMAEIVLEIETLMFWRRKKSVKSYIYKCQIVEQQEKKNWEGRLNAISEMVEELKYKFETDLNEVKVQSKATEDKFTNEFEAIKQQNNEILATVLKIINKS